MGFAWNYGQGVLVLPAEALMSSASPEELRVLLWIASDLSLAEKPMQLAKLVGCEKEAAKNAVEFWVSSGVLSRGTAGSVTETSATSVPTGTVKVLQRADQLPNYSTEELSAMMEQRASMRMLVNESQQIMGKLFTSHEINILFGLVDDLAFDSSYILLILAYCHDHGKKTMRAVERFAIGLFNDNICTAESFEAFAEREEKARKLENQVRTMFGMGERELIEKEKKMIAKWQSFGYGEEIVRMAYERNVQSKGNASILYTNAILERWMAAKLHTKEEILQEEAKQKAERQQAMPVKQPKKSASRHENNQKVGELGNSFDTDDFFEAALNRSFNSEKK